MNDVRPKFNWQTYRLPILFLFIAAGYLYGQKSGLIDSINPEGIRQTVQSWGGFGIFFYLSLFCVGQLLYIPGMFFVVIAGFIYGQFWGVAIALLGATMAISVSFYVARLVGGTPLAQAKRPLLVKLLSGLHQKPIRNIALMRLIVSTAPWLSVLLALSSISYRQYIIGSVLGFITPIVATVYFTEVLVEQLF